MPDQSAPFGRATRQPPRPDHAPEPSDTEVWGRLATTFAANLQDEANRMEPGPPRAWTEALIGLVRAVAATAADLAGEP